MTPDPEADAPRKRRALRSSGLGTAAAALTAAALLLGCSPAAPPVASTSTRSPSTTPATTVAPSTSTPSPDRPDQPSALTTNYSPFSQSEILSTRRPVPDNPEVLDPALAVYVDPAGGDDRASGTIDDPVATLEAAQLLARPAARRGDGDVVVYLRGGVYLRREPFTLDYRDSGRDGNDVVYRSYPGEQAVIEGGVRVTEWETAFDSVLVATVPDEVTEMRQFYANGARQQRARSAAADATAVEFAKGPLYGAQRNVAVVVESDLVARFSRPEDLELFYVGVQIAGHGLLRGDGSERLRPSWKAHSLPVSAAADMGNGLTRLDIANGALYHASERGYEPLELLPSDPFYFENALELLDSPGEWYFDSAARLLYWWPPSPDAAADAWIPLTEVLLSIDGTPQRPVHELRVEDIAFRHAAFTLPNEEGYVISQAASWFTAWRAPEWMSDGGVRHPFLDRERPPGVPPGAVRLDSARNITFSGNVFTELGAIGVTLENDVRHITFDRNLFVDIGAEALAVGNPEHDEIDEPMEGLVADLSFTNNVVDRAGAEFVGSAGVLVFKVDGAELSNNLLRDLPYCGFSIGWGWDNNPSSTTHRSVTIAGNYFEDVVNVLYDCAPVYLLGPVAEPGAPRSEWVKIEGNFANNSDAAPQFKAPGDAVDPDFAKRPGVQLDAGSRNVLIAGNVFAGATRWLQVTAWSEHARDPAWIEQLSLVTRDNWSDVTLSEPSDITRAGGEPARRYTDDELPPEVLAIITAAGLEPGVELPPLPTRAPTGRGGPAEPRPGRGTRPVRCRCGRRGEAGGGVAAARD